MIQVALKHVHCSTKKARECWTALQFVGLKTFGVPAVNKSLLFGGKYSFQYDGPPISGQINLSVGQGGLRNKNAPAKVKKLFKKEAMPALAELFPEVTSTFTGKLQLHFREGTLQEFTLTIN